MVYMEFWNSYSVFSSKEIFSKAIYLWTYIVIASLFFAITENMYMINSVCKFTKIEFIHRFTFMIVLTAILRNTYTLTSSFFLKPLEILVSIPLHYLQIWLVKDESKLISCKKTRLFIILRSIFIFNKYFDITKVIFVRKCPNNM